MSQKAETYERVKELKPLKAGNELGFDGQNYLVALSENDVYALAAGAYYVWSLCSGEKTVEQLVKDITVELSTASESKEKVEEEELKEPVAMILEQLAKVGLVSYK
ncbi:MAG: PqqD family peptide modification chaperone [Sulfolobales archaeon]|nr:PqqD family protein [Sulfolobales archaeon]MCX8185520.1 PqqD family protein [Sulfolobales archaeon]MDW7970001.1 PqqD family peptide modification chaperone [Sulfolobales archaeon]